MSPPGSPPVIMWPAVCTPIRPAAKSPCIVFWNEAMSVLSLIRSVMFLSVKAVAEASLLMSRRRQRGLSPSPSGCGFGERSSKTGDSGPRLTDVEAKGPRVMQPPPSPGAILMNGKAGLGMLMPA